MDIHSEILKLLPKKKRRTMEMKKAHNTFKVGMLSLLLGIILPFIKHGGGIVTGIIFILAGISFILRAIKMEDEAEIKDQTRWGNKSREDAELELLYRKRDGAYLNHRWKYEAKINNIKSRQNKNTNMTPEELYKKFKDLES